MSERIIKAADLFCGAGGFTTGLLTGLLDTGIKAEVVAVNHWETAIETHSANHPGVRHICETLDSVDPRKIMPDGRLNLLLASPECTHHSNARGGKPMSDQSRATAWHVLRWAEALYIEEIIVENVREFQQWGPLNEDGRPINKLKGALYRQFINSLIALGYVVDARILNAADFGDATSRKRLFIRASRKAKSIHWPIPTHLPAKSLKCGGRKTYRAAREIIDWTLQGKSIYNRKKPLAPNTMKRILAGLEKYSGLPFITPNFGERDGQAPRCQSIDSPVPTVTSHGAGCLVEPFVVVLRNHMDGRSIDDPIPTVAAGANHIGIAQPYLIKSYTGSDACSLDNPLPTITASVEHLALAKPVIVNMKGKSIGRSIDEPLPTQTAHAPHLYKADACVVSYHGNHKGQNDGDKRSHSVDTPLPTLDTSNRLGVASFVIKYHGNGDGAYSVDEPLDTIDTRDRYALVDPAYVEQIDGEVIGWLDIRFRMLQPHELAAAMGFPPDYEFTGTRAAKVKQIGNAVAVHLAAALCRSALKLDTVPALAEVA